MSRAWMPLYVADYLADTGHLTTAEHGAYLLLIMHYWSNGGLPDDERKLARIARMTPNEWADAGITLKGFFSDGWRHKRIDKELIDAQAAYDRRAAAGRRGGQAKAETSSNAKAMPEQCYSENVAMLKQSQSQSQSQLSSNEDNKTREARPLAVQAAFDAFWRRWPHKVGKPAAEKAFTKVSGDIEAILAGIDRYVRDKPPDRPWLNPATFLNQRRWEDAPAEIFEAIRPEPPKKISAITQAIMHLEAEINETEIPRDSPALRQIPVNGEPVARGFSFEDTELPRNPQRFHG